MMKPEGHERVDEGGVKGVRDSEGEGGGWASGVAVIVRLTHDVDKGAETQQQEPLPDAACQTTQSEHLMQRWSAAAPCINWKEPQAGLRYACSDEEQNTGKKLRRV